MAALREAIRIHIKSNVETPKLKKVA